MPNTIHELLMPRKILVGIGSYLEIGGQLKRLGKKALLISDPTMEKVGHVAVCESILRNENVAYAKYLGVDSEPTDVHVGQAVEVCKREGCDVIVAIGGGSCIDVAKAVAVCVPEGSAIDEYYGTQKAIVRKPLPLIAVPTTAGTGSEVTKVTVITNTRTQTKMMIARPELVPEVAIVDPELTVSCPPSVTAATGIDALCHAIEAYISRKANTVTDSLALSAIQQIMRYITRAYENGYDMEARQHLAVASMMAGMAFSNASVTLVHGMSRPIGALFHVPHGVSNAMLLPAVLEFTKNDALDRLAAIGGLLPEAEGKTKDELASRVIMEVKRLCHHLQIPNMKSYGIDYSRFRQALSKMADDALASGSPANNPRVPTHQEIVQLYETCYDYRFCSE